MKKLSEIKESISVEDLGSEVLTELQTKLKQLGHYNDKIDGIYGPNTKKGWAQFKQSVYLAEPDKIGESSAKKLLELTSGKVHDFSTKQGTVNAIIWECNAQGLPLKTQQAYVLATVEHETASSFKPVEEGYYLGSPEKVKAFQKRLRYFPFFGRGYVQLTWKTNYQKYSNLLGVDLVKNPSLACEPNIALFILVHGFKSGSFTGASLERYVNKAKTDFINARRCINGTDRAGLIAQMANGWLAKLR